METAREFAEYIIAFLNGPTNPLQVLTIVVFLIGLVIPKLIDMFSTLSKTGIERSNWRSKKIDEIAVLLSGIEKTAPIAAERRFKELFGFESTYDEIVAFSKCREQTKLLFLLRHKFDFMSFDRRNRVFRFSYSNPTKRWASSARTHLLLFYGIFIYAAIDFLPQFRPYDFIGASLTIGCLFFYLLAIVHQASFLRATQYAVDLYVSGDVKAR